MDQQEQAVTDDLTAEVPTGPNAPHVNEAPTDHDIDEAFAAEREAAEGAQAEKVETEREEGEWLAASETNGDGGTERDETLVGSESTPEPEPESGPQDSTADASDAPTVEGDGPGPSGPEEDARERSGNQVRAYALLEEQPVVPVHVLQKALTEPQFKKLSGEVRPGYIERPERPVARNAEVAMESVYTEKPAEHITAILPLSERNFHPVETEAEVEHRVKLNFKRR